MFVTDTPRRSEASVTPHATTPDLRRIADWINEGFRNNELEVSEEVAKHVERCDECAGRVAQITVQLRIKSIEEQWNRFREGMV